MSLAYCKIQEEAKCSENHVDLLNNFIQNDYISLNSKQERNLNQCF